VVKICVENPQQHLDGAVELLAEHMDGAG
jgi:hypothetical protein